MSCFVCLVATLLIYASFSSAEEINMVSSSSSQTSWEPTWDDLRKYTIYSYAATCRLGLTNWTCFWCTYEPALVPPVKVSVVFKSDGYRGTYGYVGVSEKEILVAFRSSASLENWVNDLEIWRVPYPGGPAELGSEVHRGFLVAYQYVQTVIRQHVKSLVASYPHLPVTVTGHSLGAALSALCTMDMVQSKIVPGDKITMVNLGEPRVGNQLFAEYFDKNVGTSYRMVNMRDLVPHLPPVWFGYYHVSREIWFETNTTSFVVCDKSGEDPKCSDSLNYWSQSDHLIYTGLSAGLGDSAQCGGVH